MSAPARTPAAEQLPAIVLCVYSAPALCSSLFCLCALSSPQRTAHRKQHCFSLPTTYQLPFQHHPSLTHTYTYTHSLCNPQVAVEVSPELLTELLGMGFGEARAARGLHFSGNSTLEGAINWLAEHEADADIDEPLLVPKVGGCCFPGKGGDAVKQEEEPASAAC